MSINQFVWTDLVKLNFVKLLFIRGRIVYFLFDFLLDFWMNLGNLFEDLDVRGLIPFSHYLVHEGDHEDGEEYWSECRNTHLNAGADSSQRC